MEGSRSESYWTAKWIYELEPGDVIFNTSDIGWIVGQSYIVFAPLLRGCTTILFDGIPDYPRKDMWWEIMERCKVTLFWTSPTGVRFLRSLGIEQAKKHDLDLERVVVAGEVLNPEVWRWIYEDVFKKKIHVFDHMWQTEVPGAMFGYPYKKGNMPEVKFGSAGFPLPGVEPEIVNDKGQTCERGEKGLLVLKKPVPGMTQTLWKNQERYVREYWEREPTKGKYFTGDTAQIDEDGYVFFSGRSDEVIKIAAHRLGAVEIENALTAHLAVAEAGVTGIPDELRGQVALALVALNPGYSPSKELENELIEHVRKTMGPIVVFRRIGFVNVLPKTRSGKIMRRIIKRLWIGEEIGDISTIKKEVSVDEAKEALSELKKES